MITSNSIYDMFIRIKNGILAKKIFVTIANTKLNLKILKIIYKENFLKHYVLIDNNEIKVFLKYHNNISFIKSLKFFPLQKNHSMKHSGTNYLICWEMNIYHHILMMDG